MTEPQTFIPSPILGKGVVLVQPGPDWHLVDGEWVWRSALEAADRERRAAQDKRDL